MLHTIGALGYPLSRARIGHERLTDSGPSDHEAANGQRRCTYHLQHPFRPRKETFTKKVASRGPIYLIPCDPSPPERRVAVLRGVHRTRNQTVVFGLCCPHVIKMQQRARSWTCGSLPCHLSRRIGKQRRGRTTLGFAREAPPIPFSYLALASSGMLYPIPLCTRDLSSLLRDLLPIRLSPLIVRAYSRRSPPVAPCSLR